MAVGSECTSQAGCLLLLHLILLYFYANHDWGLKQRHNHDEHELYDIGA